MQRYFVTINDGFASFSKEDSHHFLNVMRGKKGDIIEVINEGKIYRAVIECVDPLRAKIASEIEEERENPFKLILAFSLLKKGNDELVMQKCTELGAYSFIPFVSSRTIIRVDESDKKKKNERFSKIIKEAAMQSKRATIPAISSILSFGELLNVEADIKLIAYEDEALNGKHLSEHIKNMDESKTCLVIVGPEGGFSKEEVDKAIACGFKPISLGKRILRAETASIYVSTLFSMKECGVI